MKYSQLLCVVMAVIGFTTFLGPIPDEIVDSVIMLCRIAIAVCLMEFIPAIIKKIKTKGIQDFLMVFIMPISVCMALLIINPDISETVIEAVMIVLVAAGLIGSGILKRYFVRKWGKDINSYHPESEE